MKRVTAGADQFEDPVEALSRAWKLERCPRTQAEAAKTGNERQEQVLVAVIVRDVQEGVIRRVVLGDDLTVLRFSGTQRVFSSCDEPGIAVVAAQEALGERAQLA